MQERHRTPVHHGWSWRRPGGAGHCRSAQGTYPNKTVRYINPFPAGGATDTLSRIFCAKMSELSGQQWIVENKGGSGGNVGMDVARQVRARRLHARPGRHRQPRDRADALRQAAVQRPRDFTFVSTMWWLPNMLVVNLDVPAKTCRS